MYSGQELHKGCNATLTYALRLYLHCHHKGNTSVALTWPVQTLVATQLQHDRAPCAWIPLRDKQCSGDGRTGAAIGSR